jgi:hypothetical protein
VSGTQKWKGTAAVLKAKPTRVSATPALARVSSWPGTSSSPAATWVRCSVPVAAYTKLTPRRVTAVAVTEERKNFRAASLESLSPRLRPTSAKAGSEATSRATTSVARSREAGSSAAPAADDSSRNQNSPGGSFSRVSVRESSAVSSAPPSTRNWITSVNWSAV